MSLPALSRNSQPARRSTPPAFFRALPAYLGGKRRLCPLICSLIAGELPRSEWPSVTLLDPFSGGGSVALYAKAQGFIVVASDLAERAAVVTRALVANSTTQLRRADVLDLFREPEGDYPRVAAEDVPGVFTAEQAAWLDRAVARARLRVEPVRSLLLLLVVKVALHCQPMSMLTASDARAAAAGDYDRVSLRRLSHYLRAPRLLTPDAAWAIAGEVNPGVFGGRGCSLRGDALDVIARVGADVLYLDPPYAGTSRYEREYAALDRLLGDTAPPDHPPPTLDALLDAARDVPLVVLSYGGPTLTITELSALVARHRPVRRALAVPYPHLRSIASKEHTDANREYLVVAG